MKRCPECRKDYVDDTLLYCLDDGAELVQGTVLSEPATAIMSGESAAMPPLDGAEATAEDRKRSLITPARILIFGIAALAAITGLFAYIYIRPAESAEIKSIAVLPFENVGGNADMEYLSDGVTESLINSLSQLRGLKVIARASVFRYKGKDQDLSQAAKDLSVRAILTGHLTQRGDALDISVALTDVQDNRQIWGDHYTRKAADIFMLQDDIARQVTEMLRVRLNGPQPEEVTKRYTDNPEAYRLYLQGRHLLNEQVVDEDLDRAVLFFDQAIALDPRYALAYAGRAESYFMMGDLTLPMRDARRKVDPDVSTALSIDGNIAEARMLQANLEFQYDWDFVRAEGDFKRVLADNPNYAEAHHQYGYLLALTGRSDAALSEMKLAEQLDPVNPSIVIDVAIPYHQARQFDQAIAQSRKTLQIFPNFFLAHMVLGTSLCQKGDLASGIEELAKARTLESNPMTASELGYAYAKAGRKDDARKMLAGLVEQSKYRYVAPSSLALIEIGLGENEEAFRHFEKAFEDRSWWILWLKMDPRLEPIHSDPRYIDLVKRINYPAV